MSSKIREALNEVRNTDTGTGEYLEDLCSEAIPVLDDLEIKLLRATEALKKIRHRGWITEDCYTRKNLADYADEALKLLDTPTEKPEGGE
jgi:hypothetical protein